MQKTVHSSSTAADTDYTLDQHGNRISITTTTGTTTPCAIPTGATSQGDGVPLDGDDFDLGNPSNNYVGPNRPPVLDDEGATLEIGQSITVSPLVGDSDPDAGDTVSLVSVTESSPLISVVKSGNDVVVTSTSGSGFAEAIYVASDQHGATSQAMIRVNVDAPPPVDPSDTDICDVDPNEPGCDDPGTQPY
ncbi:MAG: hypothetical protein ABNH53_09030 [Henriciella sp.]